MRFKQIMTKNGLKMVKKRRKQSVLAQNIVLWF